MTNAYERAELLFQRLIREERFISYQDAYEQVLARRPERWKPSDSRDVINVALRTGPRLVNGFNIRLDSLIVNASRGEPGDNHFEHAPYTREEWRQAFGGWRLG